MINIIVAGCCGRMGKMIVQEVINNKETCLKGIFEFPGHEAKGKSAKEIFGFSEDNISVEDRLEGLMKPGDIVIDFTTPKATLSNLEIVKKEKAKMVIGTTGFDNKQKDIIAAAAEKVAVVMAPNMGIGINVLLNTVKQVASALGEDYNIEVIEAHHNQKKDAPSGTALALAKAAAEGVNLKLEQAVVYGRKGIVGERKKNEIGMHAIRAGDIVGEHTVLFAGTGEKIEIKHSVGHRGVFARGAVIAAKFLQEKEKGLFNMQDVLNL